MKIAVTSLKKITSKKNGKEYFVISGISKKGEAVKQLIESKDADSLSRVAIPTEAVISKLVASFTQVDVEFNEQGRVEGISLVEDDD